MDVPLFPCDKRLTDHTAGRQLLRDAHTLAARDASFLARVLAAGVDQLPFGVDEARDAMHAEVDRVRSRKSETIAHLGSIGPVSLLLGFVVGSSRMISPHHALGDGALELSDVLVPFLLGLAVALPAIVFASFFKYRLTRLTHNVTALAEQMLTAVLEQSRALARSEKTAILREDLWRQTYWFVG